MHGFTPPQPIDPSTDLMSRRVGYQPHSPDQWLPEFIDQLERLSKQSHSLPMACQYGIRRDAGPVEYQQTTRVRFDQEELPKMQYWLNPRSYAGAERFHAKLPVLLPIQDLIDGLEIHVRPGRRGLFSSTPPTLTRCQSWTGVDYFRESYWGSDDDYVARLHTDTIKVSPRGHMLVRQLHTLNRLTENSRGELTVLVSADLRSPVGIVVSFHYGNSSMVYHGCIPEYLCLPCAPDPGFTEPDLLTSTLQNGEATIRSTAREVLELRRCNRLRLVAPDHLSSRGLTAVYSGPEGESQHLGNLTQLGLELIRPEALQERITERAMARRPAKTEFDKSMHRAPTDRLERLSNFKLPTTDLEVQAWL